MAKEDLRVRKTYEALETAFVSLLGEKGFDKISVRELCERAKIRTATFYTHFSDKYDYLFALLKRIGGEYLERVSPCFERPLEEGVSSFVAESFDLIEGEAGLFSLIFSDPSLSYFIPSFAGEACHDLSLYLNKSTGEAKKAELLSECFVGAMARLSQWWIKNRNGLDREKAIDGLSHSLIEAVSR